MIYYFCNIINITVGVENNHPPPQWLEAQRSLLRSGSYLEQHRPSLVQDVDPNLMKEPQGN